MEVFSIGGASKPVKAWGPTASVGVRVHALEGIGGKGSDWLLEGVQIGAKEIVDVRQCFNDVSYIYALGNDQGQCMISLSFIIFIGTADCLGTNNIQAIQKGVDAYKGSRISQKTAAQEIGIGGFSTQGWLVEMNVGQVDAVRGVCHGVVTFLMQLEA